MVKKKVEKWANAVSAELKRQGVPLPEELVLAVMYVESRGKAGLVNPNSGASGLMQVMPGTLLDFNQRHGRNYTIADLQGKSQAAAMKQIEVGIAVLAHYWKSAYKYLSKRLSDVPIDLLGRVADLFYVAGPGRTQKRLNKLSNISWDSIESQYSKWAAMPHPRKVYADEYDHPFNLQVIDHWLKGPLQKGPAGPISEPAKDPKMGFALGVLLLMAAYWAMKGKKK